MNWEDSRGKALNIPPKEKVDFKYLELRILYVVNTELEFCINDIDINSRYAKWSII